MRKLIGSYVMYITTLVGVVMLLLICGLGGNAAIIEVPEAVAWMSPAIAGGGVPSGGVSPDCGPEAFGGGSQPEDDVASNSIFESETDASSVLKMINNRLDFDAGTDNVQGWVLETSGCVSGSETEITIKFTIEFDDIADVDDANDVLRIFYLKDSDSVIGLMEIVCVSGTITKYRTGRGYVAEYSNDVTMTGVAADTEYTAYFYYKENASTGEVSGKIGGWAEASTGGNDDNSADDGVAEILFGCVKNRWGSGTTDTHVKFDDFEVYHSDQMP